MRRSVSIGRSSSVQYGKKLEEAEDFKYVFVIYCVRIENRSAPVRELLSYC